MWVKIDDRFAEHPKLMAAGALAWGVWAEAMAYCNRNLTDGFIPVAVAEAFGGRWRTRVDGRVWQAFVHCGDEMVAVDAEFVAAALADAGLWHRVDGGYQIHDYADYQPTKAQVMAEREHRHSVASAGGKAAKAKRDAKRSAAGSATSTAASTSGSTSSSSAETVLGQCSKSAPVSRVPIPGPIAADAAAPRVPAPAHTHENAPPPPPSTPGPKASTNSSTELRPHPMPVKAPKLPPPGDTTIRDRANELVRGSPAADRLRPLAEVAIEVTGYDVGIHTLAQWLSGNYTVERVRAGCAFAVQKYAGQCVPEGTVINTATKWMLRARPDEYETARATSGAPSTRPEHQLRPRLVEPVPTPEQAARSLAILEEASKLFDEPTTPRERRATA